MGDIRQEGRGETQGAGTRPVGAGTEAGDAEGRRRTTPGESAPIKLLAACVALTEKAQKAGAAFCSGLLWNTRGLELRPAKGMLHIEQLGA